MEMMKLAPRLCVAVNRNIKILYIIMYLSINTLFLFLKLKVDISNRLQHTTMDKSRHVISGDL